MAPSTTKSTYNTRRKSLSLAELGIAIPKRSRAVSHPSPPNTVVNGEEPPVKKSKRSHDGSTSSPPPGLMSPPRTTSIRFKDDKHPHQNPAQLSPPPSPAVEGSNKVDVEGINDDIVVGTIQQLEKTGNRPHLVKELGSVLARSLHSVEKSANPSALISSRLTAYLNRPWPTISPCPVAKDLSPVHPRRLYFYLTTMPRQPIPDVPEAMLKAQQQQQQQQQQRIISPSLSSQSIADDEERVTRQRTALSPSPEVDLSSPELDEDVGNPPTPGRPFSARNSLTRETSHSSHTRRATSPQLEREERDFKQTANALFEQAQQRRNSLRDVSMGEADATAGAEEETASVAMSIEDGSNDASTLFGHADHLRLPSAQHPMDFSSPVIAPQTQTNDTAMAIHSRTASGDDMKLDVTSHMVLPESAIGWDNLQSPENVELDELEDMFNAY